MNTVVELIETPVLISISLSELLAKTLQPRENILAPWLPMGGLCMIYAERGVGKTHVALEIAMAVAYGGSFLTFSAPQPRSVLYIDGEMPENALQERLALIEKRMSPNPNMIEPIFITPDEQHIPMPNLSTQRGQQATTALIENADLTIIDNISTLCGHAKENEAESWMAVQEWGLNLRRMGKSVLFIHHAGKNGSQRGTSKREDTLDTVICLKHPSDYEPSMGACFELHFQKSRNVMGDEVASLHCTLTDDGWIYKTIELTNYDRIVTLINEGLCQKDICEEVGLSKGQVSKYVTKGRAEGKIKSG
jgi:putative DNA primase/helicase